MILRELERIKGNDALTGLYLEGISKLFQSGVIDCLRALGQPTRIALGKDINVMASEASSSAGWNACLNALLYFQEMYLTDSQEQESPRMDFNSIQKLVDQGDITKEEADAIRNNTTPSYPRDKYTGNLNQLHKAK